MVKCQDLKAVLCILAHVRMSYLSTFCRDAGSARSGDPGLRCATGNLDTVTSLRDESPKQILTPMSTASKTEVVPRHSRVGLQRSGLDEWISLAIDQLQHLFFFVVP